MQSREIKTENAFTLLNIGRLPVQFIKRWTYTDPNLLINEFDFTIAQAVVYCIYDTEDTERKKPIWKSICSDYFYCDLAAKRLRYTEPKRIEDVGGSLLRMLKFLRKGYRISPESLSKVFVRLLSGVRPDALRNDNPELYSILTGLLREVDPLTIVHGCEPIFDKDITKEN